MSVAIPEFETARLRLSAWDNRHVDPLADFMANDPGAAFVGGPSKPWESWRRLAAFIGHWHLRGFGPWAIEEKATGRWLGWVAIWHPIEFPEIELGYALTADARGHGFATEAAVRARQFAFETLKLPTLVSFIRPENSASQNVAGRLGARRDGTVMLHEKLVDVWRYPTPGPRSA